MATLTLEIPDELNAALDILSTRRHQPKAVLVRALLESTVAHAVGPASPADHWLDHWRGSLQGQQTPAPGDDRAQHLLSKHLR